MHTTTEFRLNILQVKTSPEDVGLLLAPSGAAFVLIVSFLVYRFTWGKSDYDYDS